MNDKDKIEKLLKDWAYNTKVNAKDQILNNHHDSVVIYDVLPPMKYDGVDAYMESWDEWQPETTGENLFELNDLHVVAGENVAFAYGLIHCGGTLFDGNTFEDWVRATFCLEKIKDKWFVTHQHISMPSA